MNIFLDTTVLYNDPFLIKPFNQQLIRISERNKEFKIYISKVVLEEAERHYRIALREELKKIENGISFLNTVPLKQMLSMNLLKYEQYSNAFMEYFEGLKQNNTLIVVDYTNDILPELVNRSINRIKPFSDKKEEFRDAIIWLSYSNLAETEDLDNCFLITNNVSDYSKNGQLHAEMKKDSQRFKLVKNTFGLFKQPELESYIVNDELSLWISKQEYETDKILEMLIDSNNTYQSLHDALNRYIENGRTGIDHIDYTFGKLEKINITCLKGWEFEVNVDEIFVDITIEVSSRIQIISSTFDMEYAESYILEDICWELSFYVEFEQINEKFGELDVYEIKAL